MKYSIIILAEIALVILLVVLCRAVLIRLLELRMAAYQNDLMEKHCKEVENMYWQMQGWRHDYKHHIQTMKVHLMLEQY